MTGILQNLGQKFQGDEGKARLYGLGMIASQLGAGQTVNAGPALQMLQERKAQRELRNGMQGEFLDQFSPQEQAFLATLPPQAAQQLIAQRIFSRPEPVAGTEINGQLVNPITGELMGDFRTPETPEAPETAVVNGQLVNKETGEVIGDYRDEEDGVVRYIASGEAAAALGLPADGAYNIESGPEGMKAQAIGGGGQVIQIGSDVGTIPQGFELITDEETGARRLRPIPGGPADNSAQTQLAAESEQNTADLMSQDLSRVRTLIEGNPKLTTGFIGNMMRGVAGSKAADVSALLDTIGANISFEYLNAMRQASPTGGALGQVSERELALLTATAGSLAQSQSAEQLLFNLERLEDQFNQVIHGSSDNLSDDDLLSLYGG